jgi:hypothetical protein
LPEIFVPFFPFSLLSFATLSRVKQLFSTPLKRLPGSAPPGILSYPQPHQERGDQPQSNKEAIMAGKNQNSQPMERGVRGASNGSAATVTANKGAASRGSASKDRQAGLRESVTGTPDSTYALISTAYHLLQGAETTRMFIEDAHEDGEEEVAEFLQESYDEFVQRAERAKELLAECLAAGSGDDEDEEE